MIGVELPDRNGSAPTTALERPDAANGSGVPFNMAALPERERVQLQRHSRTSVYGPGEAIYTPGDPAEHVYSVHAGQVKLMTHAPDGQGFTLSIYQPGDHFGLSALLGREQHRWRAVALGPAVVASLPRVELMACAARDGAFARRLSQLMAVRLGELEARLSDVAFKTVRQRVMRALLYLLRRFETEDGPNGRTIRINHRELAYLAGTARPTASASLSELSRRGTLTSERGRITIHDPDALEAAAG